MRASRRLHAVHRGVCAVGHGAPSDRGHWLAAVLACGPGALLGHRSCAAPTGIRRTALTYVEVVVPSRRGRIDGVHAHVCRHIRPSTARSIDGFPCTSPARTLPDLATVLPTSPAPATACCERHGRRSGTSRAASR
jgi:hypothetical protein